MQDPVLTVGTLGLNAADMKMKVPDTWKTALKKDDTITLLKAGAVNGPNKVEGDPKNDPNGYWTVADFDSVNKELVLTAKKAFSVLELDAKVTKIGRAHV